MMPLSDSTAPARALQDCNSMLSAERIAEFDKMIADTPLLLLGISNARCTYAAEKRFRRLQYCFEKVALTDEEWSYFKCKHPDEIVNGAQMHSYVYIGGNFLGNGFKFLDPAEYQAPFTLYNTDSLKQMATGANVQTCVETCESYMPAADREELEQAIATQPVVLYGWNGCPCTNIARKRFMAKGLCFLENVWSDPQDQRQQYLNCKYGDQHHSFVWIGGKFIGNGFDLADDKMSQPDLESAVNAAGGVYACQKEGDNNLWGEPLKPCTQENDGTTTGWTRSGSCVWEPSDSGYHQVCVTMSQKFLESSAKYDANDLSSVVSEGGHWCICAWAWASAVSRDPDETMPEGIQLDCERTNGRLRNVYEMYIGEGRDITSPSGAGYKPYNALQAVNKICGEEGTAASGTMERPAGSKPLAKESGETKPATTGSDASAGSETTMQTSGSASSGTTQAASGEKTKQGTTGSSSSAGSSTQAAANGETKSGMAEPENEEASQAARLGGLPTGALVFGLLLMGRFLVSRLSKNRSL